MLDRSLSLAVEIPFLSPPISLTLDRARPPGFISAVPTPLLAWPTAVRASPELWICNLLLLYRELLSDRSIQAVSCSAYLFVPPHWREIRRIEPFVIATKAWAAAENSILLDSKDQHAFGGSMNNLSADFSPELYRYSKCRALRRRNFIRPPGLSLRESTNLFDMNRGERTWQRSLTAALCASSRPRRTPPAPSRPIALQPTSFASRTGGWLVRLA